ncbi:MAG: hypothetical protein NTX50_03255 [Candidatus Sumerlaeota bacterium]|nr:hypothetical protein [Candidatus Sumerlaeota bacterium]
MKRLYMILIPAIACGFSSYAEEPPAKAGNIIWRGRELHSWKPKGEDWHFCLAPVPANPKSFLDISKQEGATTSIKSLKFKFHRLSDRGQIAWLNWADTPVPDEISKDLIKFCADISIKLSKPKDVLVSTVQPKLPDRTTTPSCFGIPCDFSGKLTEEQEKNVPDKLRGAFHVESVSEISREELDMKLKSNEKLAEETHNGVTYVALKDFRSVHFSSGISGMMIVIERYKLVP